MNIYKIFKTKISLKWKISIVFALVTFLIVFLTSLITQATGKSALTTAYEEKIQSQIIVTEAQLKSPLQAKVTTFIATIINGVLQDKSILSAFVFGTDRKIISDGTAENKQAGKTLFDSGYPLSQKISDVSDFSVLTPPEGEVRYWVKNIFFENEPVGYLVLKTGVEIESGSISIFKAFFWGILFGAIAGGIGFLFSIFIVTPISSLSDVFGQVSMGLVESRSRVETGDELEVLGTNLNEMLDRIGGLIETEADRDRMQSNIMNLLNIVDAASRGDLTVRGEVTEDALGSVADAYNLMLASISGLIRQVSESGIQVSKTTQEILIISEDIGSSAASQQHDLDLTSDLMQRLANSMEHVAVSATDAAESSTIAAKTAQEGALAVNNTIQGMNRIRTNVQTTSKKIKSLGEKSLEINAIVEVIDEISAQTNMLALNAAIEAARAGEYGRGFAVVANEIRTLAERSGEAATEIAELVKSIQNETNEAVTAMEESTGQVEIGVRLADDAGRALSEIQSVINKAANLIQEISLSAKEHAQSTQQMVHTIENARGVAENTSASIQVAMDMIRQLAASSNSLSQAISLFKV
jgi:methyl-accepting chemotaxis protein